MLQQSIIQLGPNPYNLFTNTPSTTTTTTNYPTVTHFYEMTNRWLPNGVYSSPWCIQQHLNITRYKLPTTTCYKSITTQQNHQLCQLLHNRPNLPFSIINIPQNRHLSINGTYIIASLPITSKSEVQIDEPIDHDSIENFCCLANALVWKISVACNLMAASPNCQCLIAASPNCQCCH